MLIQKPRMPLKDILLYGILPGFLKKTIYRLKGYKIGRKVSLGFGSVICGKDVTVGDFTRIAFFSIVRGEQVKIGKHVKIGSITFLDVPIIEIGDECKINEQVFVGGLQRHDSRFTLGKNCQIMQMSYINTAISITIGDDSCVGGYGLIFGHNSWLSEFEGYDAVFKPIELGKSVALSWRVFLLPGVKIGDGSVVGPNSLVNRDIPPKSLAAGFPARIISKHPDFPKIVSDDEKVNILKKIEREMIDYFNGSGLTMREENGYFRINRHKKSILGKRTEEFKLGIEYEHISEETPLLQNKDLDVFVSLRKIPKVTRKKLNIQKTMWLDIEKKERPLFWNDLGDEVALFLRRYGVRFDRVGVNP